MSASTSTQRHAPRPLVAVPLLVIGVTVVLAGILLAFALPAIKASPHQVPIGVTGPAAATGQVRAALDAKVPDAFAVSTYSSAAELREAIQDRHIYGGIALGQARPQLLTASAASPAVAQLLTGIGTSLAAAQGASPAVTDVVAPPADDPRGAGVNAALLPLFIGSISPVLLVARLLRRPLAQLATLIGMATAVGAVLAAVLHFGMHVFAGSYLLEAGAMAGIVLAMSLTAGGLRAVGGMPALGLSAAVFLLLGNPLSAAASAPEYFTGVWRAIGQGLPPGAGVQVLRSAAYFDGAGAGGSWWVLAVWATAGALLFVIAEARGARAPRNEPAAETRSGEPVDSAS